jgi:hypothetical protein
MQRGSVFNRFVDASLLKGLIYLMKGSFAEVVYTLSTYIYDTHNTCLAPIHLEVRAHFLGII